jgi:hypothetical protein
VISILNLSKSNSNHYNGIVSVKDIGRNGQLTALAGRTENRF